MRDKQEFPNELFVRFVARNYYDVSDRGRLRFLDIGAGAGANSIYLAKKGFPVLALDKNPQAHETMTERIGAKNGEISIRITPFLADAAACSYPENHFDCIFDINTLCHVKEPPMLAIHDSLKKDGKFFCIAPTNDTWKERVMEGKDYCRFNDKFEMLTQLKPFSEISVRRAEYPDTQYQMRSWICEASA